MNRPTRPPDFTYNDDHYWSVLGPDGRPCIYIADHINCDWYVSVFDSVMMDDLPLEVHQWYKTVAPANVLVYFPPL